ncbi:MAG: DNA-protecting protein DprA [Candidatus Omnitrophica bacterium]|nr:DNA-protecting protein DprA [Candidatus Omnitrophota bacterium]
MRNDPNELREILALSLVKNMGPVAFKRLLETFGSVSAIFRAPVPALRKVKGARRAALEALKDPSLFKKADAEIKKANDAGVEILSFFDTRYPEELKEIYDPPILLYVKGSLEGDAPRIAVVGSRSTSIYGRETTRRLSRELAAAGLVVVSGLAEGIDTAAHEGALEGRGRTFAVLGGGLSRIYPKANEKLAQRICQNGALLSEYPMEMAPLPQYFPVRNRLISGLSRAVLVIEARKNSGALITADAALEQGREVFAVPGNIDSIRSEGTNSLLRDGAKLVTSAADILDEWKWRPGETVSEKRLPRPPLEPAEKKLLSLLDAQSLQIETLIEESRLPVNQALSLLSVMEMKGLVKELPGKHYAKK